MESDRRVENLEVFVKQVACFRHRKRMNTSQMYDFVVNILACLNTGTEQKDILMAVVETCEIVEKKEKERKTAEKELLKVRSD